jgi:SagB-type dehydrogenase family enzyme
MQDSGDRFQQETKYALGRIGGRSLDWARKPGLYKDHKMRLEIIPLPEPDLSGQPDLWQALRSRRSRRSYDPKRILAIGHLASLLWATQGITEEHGEILFRTAPSAGALYPVETYLSVNHVGDLRQGIYHFRPNHFDLELLSQGDFSGQLAGAALGQKMIERAQVTFIWSAVADRSKWKYDQRAYRYIYLDAGHIAQNLYLAGEALGLGVCAIGALFDDEVNQVIGLDGVDETVVYMASVGWPEGK